MDPRSQAFLETILKKESYELIPEEVDFLKARRLYLNEEQIATYRHLLKDKPEEKLELTYKEMMQKARDLGFKVKVGLTKAELQAMINSTV